MNQQLALAIQLNNDSTLADFCWRNNPLLQEQLFATLKGQGERIVYLWGVPGCGKTHLLQACCQQTDSAHSAIYLPLAILHEWGPDMLDGIANHTLICIDNIDLIAENPAWEEAIFHLYNRIRDNDQALLIIAGNQTPMNLGIALPDLRSRLSWGLVMQVNELRDEDKIYSLKLHAHNRGFELASSVAQFLLNRCGRNMHELHALLNSLDEASLRAQRKITIPFVKEILSI